MINDSQSQNMSVNLGTFRTAPLRRAAYVKAAQKDGFESLGLWVKRILDDIAGFDESKIDKMKKRR